MLDKEGLAAAHKVAYEIDIISTEEETAQIIEAYLAVHKPAAAFTKPHEAYTHREYSYTIAPSSTKPNVCKYTATAHKAIDDGLRGAACTECGYDKPLQTMGAFGYSTSSGKTEGHATREDASPKAPASIQNEICPTCLMDLSEPRRCCPKHPDNLRRSEISDIKLGLVECDCNLLGTKCHRAEKSGASACSIFKRPTEPVSVSLHECVKAMERLNHPATFYEQAKAVLDAAGVKYVD